jgi:5-methylcytosine-specific restriction endonuclease McrA
MLTILWHDAEVANWTDHIPNDWLSCDGQKEECVHFVVGPRSGHCEAKCSINVQGNTAELDYRPFENFNLKRGMFIGVLRIQFTTPSRESVSQVWWKDKGEKNFKPCSTTIGFVPDLHDNFEAEVAASSKLTSHERRKRLAAAEKNPQRISITTTGYRRNPDVVAEVLSRADGKCERCNKPAPFKRVNTGIPYLEVHHRTRLADGGEDTVENAIALCPNCHREAHYG